MCYAIPGKVLKIDGDIITVEYFGEKRRAKNEFFALSCGEYVYAQGGFVIQKLSSAEALSILKTWEELFFKLQEIDLSLARQQPKNLKQAANELRQKYHGNSCCIHGIIEFSNYCRSNCLYCGLRRSNAGLRRYRMGIEKIVETAEFAVNKLGFKALVLQSGEDIWYNEERLLSIIRKIKKKSPCLITLSIGERDIGAYEKLYREGCRGALLRFETSNPSIYAKLKGPPNTLQGRLNLINKLRELGYLIMSGFLIGLPEETKEDMLNNIKLTQSLGAEMFSFGPFIPHPKTPLAGESSPSMDEVLNVIARARIMNAQAKILVTTALETLDKKNAVRLGLMSGANSLMINVTPERYSRLYEIYPNRAGIDSGIAERTSSIVKLLRSIGRAPTDLGL